METGNNTRIIYYNPAQMRSMNVKPRHERNIVGRGGGKTTNIQSPRLKAWLEAMPRGVVGLIGASYMQLFTRILPGIVKGFRDLGWIDGRDYWVGGYAPKLTGIPRPYKTPLKSDYVIHTKKGSAITLFSQDKPGMSNGVDLCALSGDEAKFLSKDRLDEEVIPAIRGEAHVFGGLWCYQGTLFTSDMPSNPSGLWLLEEKGTSDDIILKIEAAQHHINILYRKYHTYSESYQAKVRMKIAGIENMLNAIRARTTMVQYSSSLQNLNVLGLEWLMHMIKTLDPDEFSRSILTLKRIRGKTSFYAALDEMKHGYLPRETHHVLQLGYDFEKLSNRSFMHDEESEWDIPTFHIGVDSGGSFNCLVVAVVIGRTIYVINNIWLPHPGKIVHVVQMFKEYYQSVKNKRVVFHYDQTAIGTRAETEYTVADIVTNTLRSHHHGQWFVEDHYMRQTPSYQLRMDEFDALFKGTHETFDGIRFNRLNCEQWYESCIAADVKQIGNKTEKDKSSEKKSSTGKFKVSQEKATHLSEAGDMVIHGIITYNQSVVAVH